MNIITYLHQFHIFVYYQIIRLKIVKFMNLDIYRKLHKQSNNKKIL